MMTTYQLSSGDRPIELREAFTAQQALFDYLRSLGCEDEDLMKLAPDAVSWRGGLPSGASFERPGSILNYVLHETPATTSGSSSTRLRTSSSVM
jgi:hypothetical protein